MSLPINIDRLITTNTVEWERKEFKKGWNPENVMKSICAFANDVNNWGGGYIILGIEEKKGRPVLPAKGIDINKIDDIQKEIIEVCNKLQPKYFPVIEPIKFNDVHLIILWCPGGDNKPYSAPTTMGKKAQRLNYVRRGSSTVKTNSEEFRQLYEQTAKIPFDDRINHNASINDLSLMLIREYLHKVKSKLYDDLSYLDIKEIGQKMQIIKGSSEYLKPTNVGLLMFSENPQKYFESAYIDIAVYQDDYGTKYEQKIFKGTIYHQINSALDFLKNNVVKLIVEKIEGQAEAERYFNYPFEAIEEALVNAVFHKGYENENQIEVHVRLDKIEIISYPGALPPIDNKALKRKTIVARHYRNRRIGDFLKELNLTESKGTGFPTIYKYMANNNSPVPIFQMDDNKTYFLVILKTHPKSLKISKELEILRFCQNPRDRRDILKMKLKISNQTRNYDRHIFPLIKKGFLDFTIPEKQTSVNQKYKITNKGLKYIKENEIRIRK